MIGRVRWRLTLFFSAMLTLILLAMILIIYMGFLRIMVLHESAELHKLAQGWIANHRPSRRCLGWKRGSIGVAVESGGEAARI